MPGRWRSLAETFAAAFPVRPIFTNSTPAWTLRLGVGLAQGIGLTLLWLGHARGSDPSLFIALLLAGLIAPLTFLEACDRVELKLLLLWSGTLAFVIATLGLLLPSRGGLAAAPIGMLALLVLLAHITVRTALHQRILRSGLDAWMDTGWTVIVRLLVWATVATIVLSILGVPALLTNPLHAAPSNGGLIGVVVLALASGTGFALAAGWLRRSRPVLLTCCAAVLALLILGQGPQSARPRQQTRANAPDRSVSIPISAPAAPAPAPRARPGQPAPAAQAKPDGEIVLHSAREFPASLLGQDWSGTQIAPCLTTANRGCDVWFLDRDGREDVLLAYQDGGRVRADLVQQSAGGWTKMASATSPCPGLLARMRAAQQDTLPPGWREVLTRRKSGAELPCPRA
jgi:hypothetical protein